ncbi:MAG: Vi polysaccharide biosynthesis UDP-N-acetylglucosamine C-6 dehydrogenase TviB, partial [Caulobacteraceae bacterium]
MLLNPFTQTPAKIGVIGLGYVGLPLAVALAAKYEVVGFDINSERIAELKAGHDRTLEATPEELAGAKALSFASDEAALAACNVFIVT